MALVECIFCIQFHAAYRSAEQFLVDRRFCAYEWQAVAPRCRCGFFCKLRADAHDCSVSTGSRSGSRGGKLSSVMLSVVYGYPSWKEPPSLFAFLGAILIIAGGLLLVKSRFRVSDPVRSE
jgi:hypothetical protein